MKVRYHAAKILKKVWPGVFDFTSDGCTASPDAWWRDCCLEHDYIYANPDSGYTRKEADQMLKACMKRKGAILAPHVYYAAVRIFGDSYWNDGDRKNERV
jgi:hypothetical protein